MAKQTQLLGLLALPLLLYPKSQVNAIFVGGGLTILAQNELDAAPNNNTAAILVHRRSSFSAARTACSQLGEDLFNLDKADFNAILNSSLLYQSYLGIFPVDQRYWIAEWQQDDDERQKKDSKCRTVDVGGTISQRDCLTELPALCTQSALLSNRSFPGLGAAEWRVTQEVNGIETRMTGYRDYHTWKFKGVRYAKTPERFEYSIAPYLQRGELLAVDSGADCTQPIGEVTNGSSEDCLFMNIWTTHLPQTSGPTSERELRPVMLYVYGGGFTGGTGKSASIDGTNLASRGDTVVVNINYRVGNLGFLPFNDGIHNGNYAISDILTALEWVKRYIQFFGGDPDRVTLFGQSSGAAATRLLLGSPKAKGLFIRAITHSSPEGYPLDNGEFTWLRFNTTEQAYETSTKQVILEAGCSDAKDQLACLKKIDGFALVSQRNNFFSPVVDGVYLTNPILTVNQTGQASNIDIITGVNRDETGVFINEYPSPNDSLVTYATRVLTNGSTGINLSRDYVKSLTEKSVFSLPPNASAERIFNITNSIYTGGEFNCYDRAKAFTGAKHKAFKSVYIYELNRTYSSNGYTRPWCSAPKTLEYPYGDVEKEYYKCHGGEQFIVFGNIRRSGYPDRDGKDVPFMQLVVDYWSSFARTGDPNPNIEDMTIRGHWNTLQQIAATGRWLPVDPDNPKLRLLQWNGVQTGFGGSDQCDALGIPLDILEP